MSLKVEQRCHHEGEGWWRWAVWLTGNELAGVNFVEYTLHPTFPQPHVVVQDRESGFRIERTGWGEFRIYLTAHLRDGSTCELQHWLKLRQESPGGEGLEAPSRGATTGAPSPESLEKPSPDESYEVVHEPQPHRVFLTSSLADAAVLEEIREHLVDQGIEVASANDLASGPSWEAEIEKVLRGTDAVVVLLDPERASLWTLRDAEVARDSNIRVIPVLLGGATATWLPDWMRDLKALRADRSAPELLAEQIVRTLQVSGRSSSPPPAPSR